MSAYPSYPQEPQYPQQPPPAAPKRGMSGWLIAILCVAGTLALLVPVLVVLGVYGMRKYIAKAKTTEARVMVSTLAKDASTTADAKSGFCASASAPVPPSLASIHGAKYQSTAREWDADAATHAGFACLGFSITAPQYYRYSYTAVPGRRGFEAIAQGDLDGDGILSKYASGGTIDASGTVTIAPVLVITRGDE